MDAMPCRLGLVPRQISVLCGIHHPGRTGIYQLVGLLRHGIGLSGEVRQALLGDSQLLLQVRK